MNNRQNQLLVNKHFHLYKLFKVNSPKNISKTVRVSRRFPQGINNKNVNLPFSYSLVNNTLQSKKSTRAHCSAQRFVIKISDKCTK